MVKDVGGSRLKNNQGETALGEALKTKRKRRKRDMTIRVCDYCSTPLIFTFAFAYKERYCLNCGTTGGMLGTGEDVPVTRELKAQKAMIDAVWKQIYGKKGGLLPDCRFGRTNCKKDNGTCHNHHDHLTKAEKENNLIALDYLKRFKGFFSPTTH